MHSSLVEPSIMISAAGMDWNIRAPYIDLGGGAEEEG